MRNEFHRCVGDLARSKRTIIYLAIAVIIIIVASSLGYYYLYAARAGTIAVIYQSSPQTGRFVSVYPTQSNETSPNAIAVDSHGNVWFTLENESKLAELIPSNGTIHEYNIPGAGSGGTVTWGIAVENSKNLVWFTEQESNAVWSFDMTKYTFKKYPLHTTNALPFDIALDASGNVWFTELYANKIGEISSSGRLTETSIPMPGDIEPAGIAVDSAGKVWFTLAGANSIGSFYQGSFEYFNLSGQIYSPVGIAVDKNENVWITQHGPSLISEFNPSTNSFRSISTSVPPPPLNASLPYFVYVDSQGRVWINEHYGNSIAVLDPETGNMTEYKVPTHHTLAGDISGMLTMEISPYNGDPWFTEFFSGSVGTVNASEPLGLSLQINNQSSGGIEQIHIAKGGSATLGLSVNASETSPIELQGFTGNITGGLSYAFSPSAGAGSFRSNLTITASDSKSGVYFVTISASTSDLVVSRVVEVIVS